ncbi:hypothetical protein Tco_0103032 [Tanacetum coccineum]
MFYPRFTKVIINYFMSQDQSIPRRNKVDWHMANDDPILTTMRFIPQHEVIPKLKYVRRSTKEKPKQAPEASFGKRLKATAKVTKSGKKNQPAKGLETLSEIALSEAEQMKLAIERSKTQLHSSQPSNSGTNEGTGKSSDEEDDDDEANIGKDEDDNDQDDDERTKSKNDGDDFVHLKLSTHDDEARNDDEVNEEESNEESNDESNEESDEKVQGANTEEEEMDEEATHEEDEANELYRDVNVNLEGRDSVMIDAPLPNVQSLVELEYFFEEVYKATTDQLDWNNPKGQQYPLDLRKPLPLIPNSRGRQVIPFDHFINNNLAYLSSGQSDKFNVEDRLAFGVSLRMFTRSIVIQRHVEDLQLGVESYQKKPNITKPDTYRSDLKCRDAYTAYSNPKGFIYQNKDKKNKLMRIDKLYKFSDDTLDDVRTALNNRLKGIRMECLPQTIWRQSDKERPKAMIQAIDK